MPNNTEVCKTHTLIYIRGYPSSHDALANNTVHDSNRLQNHTPKKPISTLRTAAQTPQHETIAQGHTARAKADHTADTQTPQLACP